MSDRITRSEWRAMTPREKGYAVYMAGARTDQPNIPESYRPRPADRAEYEAGQQQGIMEVMMMSNERHYTDEEIEEHASGLPETGPMLRSLLAERRALQRESDAFERMVHDKQVELLDGRRAHEALLAANRAQDIAMQKLREQHEADQRALAGAPEIIRAAADRGGCECERCRAETAALLALLRSHEQHEAEKRALAERVKLAALAAIRRQDYGPNDIGRQAFANGLAIAGHAVDALDLDALLAEPPKCICGGNPGEYEGPLRDCPLHGEPPK